MKMKKDDNTRCNQNQSDNISIGYIFMKQNCSGEQYNEVCDADTGICKRQRKMPQRLLPDDCLEKKAAK